MLDVRRLPAAVVTATFVLSGLVATTGVASLALGVEQASAAPCPHIEEDRPARGILDCLGPSTVYITSPVGSGSGLVLPDGHVLTNAHVVDPWPSVDLKIGDEVHDDVPVVGVDHFADIAVLGPIDTEAPSIDLIDPSELVEGDPLFLVGYPGEANDEDLKPTIADGILSRTRHSETFGLSYLQTDASIGGGQSGGAIVDTTGAVVGISSLRFAENFALALSGVDAQVAVDKILAGDGSPYAPWPGGEPVPSGVVKLEGEYVPTFVTLPDVPGPGQTIDITIPTDQPVIIVSGSYESDQEMQFGANFFALAAEEFDVPLSDFDGVPIEEVRDIVAEEESADLAPEVAPGTYRFDLPEGEHPMFVFLSNRPTAFDLPVSASMPFVPIVSEAPVDVAVGAVIQGTVGGLVPYDTYNVPLTAGQQIEIYAGSPSGDMHVYVQGPDQDPEDAEEFDDSKAGLYGLDVKETYTATADGVHRIEVGQYDPYSTGYHFEIRDPA